MIRKKLATGILGLASIVGCIDHDEDIILSEGNVGDTRVRIIENSRSFSPNSHSMELTDKSGSFKARCYINLHTGGFFQYDDKTIIFRDGKIVQQTYNKE